jgi:hypothetical protein
MCEETVSEANNLHLLLSSLALAQDSSQCPRWLWRRTPVSCGKVNMEGGVTAAVNLRALSNEERKGKRQGGMVAGGSSSCGGRGGYMVWLVGWAMSS